MWSLDGDTLIFPKDVSLTVGNNSNIRHLVLQVHYVSKDNIPETGDTRRSRQSLLEVMMSLIFSFSSYPGIVTLRTTQGFLATNSVTYWDSACRLLGRYSST